MHNPFVLNFRSAATIRNDSDAKVYKIVLKFRLLPPPCGKCKGKERSVKYVNEFASSA